MYISYLKHILRHSHRVMIQPVRFVSEKRKKLPRSFIIFLCQKCFQYICHISKQLIITDKRSEILSVPRHKSAEIFGYLRPFICDKILYNIKLLFIFFKIKKIISQKIFDESKKHKRGIADFKAFLFGHFFKNFTAPAFIIYYNKPVRIHIKPAFQSLLFQIILIRHQESSHYTFSKHIGAAMFY